MIKYLVDIVCSSFFTFNHMKTCDHNFKITIQHSRLNCRYYSIISRVTPIWNILDMSIGNCRTQEMFKRELDKRDMNRICRVRAHTVTQRTLQVPEIYTCTFIFENCCLFNVSINCRICSSFLICIVRLHALYMPRHKHFDFKQSSGLAIYCVFLIIALKSCHLNLPPKE